jgi:hypothetical protein
MAITESFAGTEKMPPQFSEVVDNDFGANGQ